MGRLTAINGPARASASAVRNPTYGSNGQIISGGSVPGATDLPVPGINAVSQSLRGNPRALLQAILMNAQNPYQNKSLEEEELRRSALSRLRG